MSTNLVNYMKEILNQGNSTAVNNVTNWSGTCYITPLLGAFVADAYLGRYKTISYFMLIYIAGLVLLTLTATVKGLTPSCHCDICEPTSAQTAVVFVSLYMVALGTGGIKPCVSSFGADQFDETDESEKESKSSFFNWFYLSINVGSLVASSLLVWIQTNVGWGWGFGIPAVMMAIAVVCFFVGTPLYRNQLPGGSPLTRIMQVLVACFRKYNEKVPSDATLLYEAEDNAIITSNKYDDICSIFCTSNRPGCRMDGCLDKAAVITESDQTSIYAGQHNPWKLCSVTQVEELKCIIRLLPIWASGIIFSAVYSQMTTMFVLQGDTLDPSLGPKFKIPSASLSLFDTISVILWIPLYDKILVPMARRITGDERGFSQLTRMGIGLVISVIAMLAAGILEIFRLRTVAKHNMYDSSDFLPLSIFWQIPQYFIVGAAEVFTFVGQLEFFYDQAPDAMRSMCSALSLTTNALGNYLSSVLVIVVAKVTTKNGSLGWIPDSNLNRGHLDYFYWFLAALSFLNFLVYLI